MKYHIKKPIMIKAWELLIRNNIIQFPVNLDELLKKEKITLLTFDEAGDIMNLLDISISDEAIGLIIRKKKYILYNPNILHTRLRLAIVHEIGHFELGHIKNNEPLKKYSEQEETEAFEFGARVLMPAIVIRHYKLSTVPEYEIFFEVSNEAANIRFKEYNRIVKKNMFLSHPLEREYYTLFKRLNKID